jgi:zinc protease
VVTAALVLPVGEAALDAGQAGLARLTADALEGGTKRRSGTAMAEALEAIGADASVSAGWDSTVAYLSCLADNLDEGLDLLVEMVLAPSFPADEVERTRDQQLARIRQRGADPSSLAADHTAALVYAEGEPYGRYQGGTEAALAGVDAAATRAFAEAWYRPAGAGFVLTGDVDADHAADVCARLLRGWEGAAPARPDVAGAARSGTRSVHVVHRPGAVQSEIRIGEPGVPRSTPDYPELVVANAVLGGTFTSRLNLNLREERGFTYGVRSRFAFRRGPGPFTVSTAVDTDVTADAVREAVGEITRYVGEGPSPAEVASAREYIAGVFPLRLETTGQMAGRVAELLIYDLPEDAWTRYREEIRGVEAETAHRAFARAVNPDALTVVVVGDATRVRGPLEQLELGPVTVHEVA